MVGVIQDLSIAGSDTQAHATHFAIRYLVQNPKIQEKLQKEIDEVRGNNPCITLADKPRYNSGQTKHKYLFEYS